MSDSAQLTDLVEKLRDIPTLSVVVQRVMELVNNPKTSAPQIADVLKKDQVLTAKVLRLVNSSFYNLSTEVTDVSRALAFLGFNSISMLVLGTSVFSSFELKKAPYFNVLEFWRHSLASAIAAELIAKELRVGKPEEAFSCGLLHDVGKIALFTVEPDLLQKIVDTAKEDNISFFDAESKLELPSHTVLGERLATRWQLPLLIQKTIRYHHRDIEPMESIFAAYKPTIMVASLGNVLAKRFQIGESGDNIKPEFQANYMNLLNLSEDKLKEIEKKFPAEVDRASSFLSASLS